MHGIVTGGASGIGRASAIRLARRMKITIADRDLDDAQSVVEEIKRAGGEAQALRVDVAERANVFDMVARATDKFGAPECLFANAGINRRNPVDLISEADWDLMMDVHVKGMFLCAQAVIPHMLTLGHGAIVNTASDFAVMGVAGNATYTAAKTAIYSLTKSMAVEFTPRKIRVNAIGPGPIDTPLLASGRSAEQYEAVRAKFSAALPLRRMGTPEEVAVVVDFLLSDKASYISGQLLHPNGGQLLW